VTPCDRFWTDNGAEVSLGDPIAALLPVCGQFRRSDSATRERTPQARPERTERTTHSKRFRAVGVVAFGVGLLALRQLRSIRCSRRQTGVSKELHSGLFPARPKTYEFRLPTFLTGIVSFQCPYLICEWFMGSHRAREGNARSPPSLIYAGIPLGFPRPPLPPGFFQQLPSIWILIARGSSTAPHTNEKGRPQCRRVVFESLLKRSIAGTARAIAVAA
jgi:hypothetical protein